MKNLLILALTLVLTSVAVSQVVIPSGWGTCGAFWANKCARFCLATGRVMNFCRMDRAWSRSGALVGAAAVYQHAGARLPDWNYVRAAYPYEHRFRRHGVRAVDYVDYGHTRTRVGLHSNIYLRGLVGNRPRGFVRRPNRRVNARARARAYDRVGSRVNRVQVRGNVGAAKGLRRRAFLQTEVKQIIRVWKYANHVNCNCI